jgi:hypothetical protein
MPATLYTLGFSVWGAAVELAVIELRCNHEVEKKEINLASGNNFYLAFISQVCARLYERSIFP